MRVRFFSRGMPKDALAAEFGVGERTECSCNTVGAGTELGCGANSDGLDGGDGSGVVLFSLCDCVVDYTQELKGESCFFEEIARLSKETDGVVVCGCTTDTHGHRRRSAVVAERGRILGVSDMLHAIDGEIACGAGLRVYETVAGKIGVAVGEDLRFPDVFAALALCGSEFVVCPFARVDEVHVVLARAHAYCFGVPVLLCGQGYAAIADADGRIAFATPLSQASAEFRGGGEYHLVETRSRFNRTER